MEIITLKAGESIALRFKSQAMAGYVWDYEMDKTGITSVAREGAANDMMKGQTPDEIFTVSGIHPGTVQLTFQQRRSWQKDKPIATKEYQIKVE